MAKGAAAEAVKVEVMVAVAMEAAGVRRWMVAVFIFVFDRSFYYEYFCVFFLNPTFIANGPSCWQCRGPGGTWPPRDHM